MIHKITTLLLLASTALGNIIPTKVGDTLELRFTMEPGFVYVIQQSDDLVTWDDILFTGTPAEQLQDNFILNAFDGLNIQSEFGGLGTFTIIPLQCFDYNHFVTLFHDLTDTPTKRFYRLTITPDV